MKHYGDITKLNGHNLPLVDIVTGGSPCQDLSVAGKRAGLAGERSGLFMEQIRIIKEMRDESTKQLHLRGADVNIRFIQPRYMVWENVPGAFSSNKGEDFRAVLEETAKIVCEDAIIPRPEGGVGHHQAASWEMGGALLGEYMTRSFGECPSVENVSLLSQILEESPHPKYSLSAKACQGILRRAEKRGKKLPELLEKTLIKQSAFKNEPESQGGAREYSYNMSEQEPYRPSIISQCWDGTQTSPTLTANNAGGSQRMPDKENFNAVITYGVDCYNQTQNEEITQPLRSINADTDHIPCVYGIDRASFNQGQNAQYDFSVTEEQAQTLVSRGPGGVLSRQSVPYAQEITKE